MRSPCPCVFVIFLAAMCQALISGQIEWAIICFEEFFFTFFAPKKGTDTSVRRCNFFGKTVRGSYVVRVDILTGGLLTSQGHGGRKIKDFRGLQQQTNKQTNKLNLWTKRVVRIRLIS